jgi:hypothetical protein
MVFKNSRLRKINQVFHNSIVNRLGNKARVRDALVKREKHLTRLKQNPFFKKLLSKRQKFVVTIDGKEIKFTLISKGIKEVNIWSDRNGMVPTKINIVLDHLGRVRFFGKPNSKRHDEPWEEYRGLTIEPKFDNGIRAKKRLINDSELSEDLAITKVLEKHKRIVKYDLEIELTDLIEIQKLL